MIFNIGRVKIFCLDDGIFRLDGGAMFGVVPKVLWKKKSLPDRLNRILLALHPILIVTHDNKKILVDTGIGTWWDKKAMAIYGIKKTNNIFSSLKEYNFQPKDIDYIVPSHLHFDHIGNAVYRDGDKFKSAFQKARFLIQKKEWERATNPTERDRRSYIDFTFLPIEENKQIDKIDGNYEVSKEVRIVYTGGHSKGHQMVIVGSEGKNAIYWGDLIPTTAHIDLPYIMGYDIDPDTTIQVKREYLKKVVEGGWLSFWDHDPNCWANYLKYNSNGKIIAKSMAYANLR